MDPLGSSGQGIIFPVPGLLPGPGIDLCNLCPEPHIINPEKVVKWTGQQETRVPPCMIAERGFEGNVFGFFGAVEILFSNKLTYNSESGVPPQERL